VTDLMMRQLADLGDVAYAPDLPVTPAAKSAATTGEAPRATG
jgi:hypothetical protein